MMGGCHGECLVRWLVVGIAFDARGVESQLPCIAIATSKYSIAAPRFKQGQRDRIAFRIGHAAVVRKNDSNVTASLERWLKCKRPFYLLQPDFLVILGGEAFHFFKPLERW